MSNSEAKTATPNWLWPKMDSVENAESAIKVAVGVAILSCAITTVVSFLPLFGKSFYGFGLMSLIDVSIIGLLALGLRRKSRICAVSLISFFVLGKVQLFTQLGSNLNSTGLVSSLIFGLFFLNGTRGTFAYWKLSEQKPKGFRWQSIVWILAATVAILAIGLATYFAENAIIAKRIEPIFKMVEEGKYDEANDFLKKATGQFGDNQTTIDTYTNFKAQIDFVKFLNEGAAALESENWLEAKIASEGVIDTIADNLWTFSLDEEILRNYLLHARDVFGSYGDEIDVHELEQAQDELIIWIEENVADEDARYNLESYCEAQISRFLAEEYLSINSSEG